LTLTTDPRWVPPTRLTAVDRWLLTTVRDERDLAFPRTAFDMTVQVVPATVVMLLLPTPWMLALLAPYLAFVFTQFAGRYMLTCHATMHRPAFTRAGGWVQTWMQWGLGPLVGCTPTSYQVHHMGMHHPENNLSTDLSTTLPYQRDRFSHFLHYWARFFFVGLPQLAGYLQSRGRSKLTQKLLLGELGWIGLVLLVGWFNLPAAIGVLVVPWFILRWAMMCGNFAQHAFVDVADANNAYRNSTSLINSPHNRKCYNDGYHAVHHVKANLHWSEMAQWYDDHREEFARQDAVVFDGLNSYQHLWWLLMTQQYGRMADHLVDFHGRTREEKIAFLQSRARGTLSAA
jgi:fatty acid desaturase